MNADKMVIINPRTAEKRFLVNDKNQVIDLRNIPHEHEWDNVQMVCKVCGRTMQEVEAEEK